MVLRALLLRVMGLILPCFGTKLKTIGGEVGGRFLVGAPGGGATRGGWLDGAERGDEAAERQM